MFQSNKAKWKKENKTECKICQRKCRHKSRENFNFFFLLYSMNIEWRRKRMWERKRWKKIVFAQANQSMIEISRGRELTSGKKLTTYIDLKSQWRKKSDNTRKLLTCFFLYRRLQFALHHNPNLNTECVCVREREQCEPQTAQRNISRGKKRWKLIANFYIKSKRKCMWWNTTTSYRSVYKQKKMISFFSSYAHFFCCMSEKKRRNCVRILVTFFSHCICVVYDVYFLSFFRRLSAVYLRHEREGESAYIKNVQKLRCCRCSCNYVYFVHIICMRHTNIAVHFAKRERTHCNKTVPMHIFCLHRTLWHYTRKIALSHYLRNNIFPQRLQYSMFVHLILPDCSLTLPLSLPLLLLIALRQFCIIKCKEINEKKKNCAICYFIHYTSPLLICSSA